MLKSKKHCGIPKLSSTFELQVENIAIQL